jgi:menaquinone-dependent protoporphyrinogen oxidase
MSRILIAYASSHGQTRKIAETIAADLYRSGHVVELASALAGRPPPVQDYDAVVLGSRVQFGTHARPIIDYITANRAALAEIPSYFFSVSMSTAGAHVLDPEGYLEKLFATTRWQPRQAVAIAGGLPYLRYGFLLRMVMKLISRRNGHATDTRRDHEYTDWAQVRRFAASIASDLVAPSLFPTPLAGAGRDAKA